MSDPAPRQNKALQGGGAASIGIGGVGGSTIGTLVAPFLNKALEGTGIDLDQSWYTAFGALFTVALQLAATKLFKD